MQGSVGITGALSAKKLRNLAPLSWRVKNAVRFDYGYAHGWLMHSLAPTISKLTGLMTVHSHLSAIHQTGEGVRTNYGVIGYKVVTTAFAEYMVDQLQTETSSFGDYKHHDGGVGSTAANITDTDMETTDGESRASGTQTESTAVIYESVGTIAYSSTKAITEHGIFNASSGATLLDRTVFSAINVVNGDSIQFTYDLTVTAGG